MIFAKDINYGLDVEIKDLQDYLNTNLASFWSGTLNIFGKLYRNSKDGNYIYEAYKGTGIKNKEYGEVFFDDKVAAVIGVRVISRDIEPYDVANCDLIFTLDLKQIYPLSTSRDDEKAILEARKVINNYDKGFLKGIKIGINQVFTDVNTYNIIYLDMHPWLVFALNIDIHYSEELVCQ